MKGHLFHNVRLGINWGRAKRARKILVSKKEHREVPKTEPKTKAKRMPQKLQNPLNSLCFVRKGAARRAPKTDPEIFKI